MKDLVASGFKGGEVLLRGSEVSAFKAGLKGRLISPEESDYEAARRIWNSMIDRRPALIIRPGPPIS
jgi:hypothetical protein